MSFYLESKRQLIVNASFTEKPGKKYPKNDVCTREGDKKPYPFSCVWWFSVTRFDHNGA